jgi:hypothetical protein
MRKENAYFYENNSVWKDIKILISRLQKGEPES